MPKSRPNPSLPANFVVENFTRLYNPREYFSSKNIRNSSPIRRWQVAHQGGGMSADKGSVSGWVSQLQAGDTSAAQRLWQRYFHRMVRLARARLRAAGIRSEEEDV